MKGQISFVEYLAALMLFITSVIFIAFSIISFVPQYLTQVNNQKVRIDAYQISELLTDDPGNPINWYSVTPIFRMGLSNESVNRTNYISLQKINAFNNYCSAPLGYNNIKRNISAVDNFAIFLFNRTASAGNILISCQPIIPFSSPLNNTIRRIVAIDSGDIGELIVQTG